MPGVVHEDLDRPERRLDLAEGGVDGRRRRRRRPAPRAPRRPRPRPRRCVSLAPSSSDAVAERDPVARRARARRRSRGRCPRDAPVTNATRPGASVGHARPHRSSALPQVMPGAEARTAARGRRRGGGRRRRPRPARAGSRPPTCCRSGRCSRACARAGCPSRLAAASMMRTLAWWGTNQSTSATVDAGPRRAWRRRLDDGAHRPPEDLLALHLAGSARRPRPSRRDAGSRLPPAGISSRPVAEPSQPRSQASRPGPSSGEALSTTAAAPSPKRMHGAAVVRVDDAATASRRRRRARGRGCRR